MVPGGINTWPDLFNGAITTALNSKPGLDVLEESGVINRACTFKASFARAAAKGMTLPIVAARQRIGDRREELLNELADRKMSPLDSIANPI
jgi:hypothetical protein